jgi:hypothetical protein
MVTGFLGVVPFNLTTTGAPALTVGALVVVAAVEVVEVVEVLVGVVVVVLVDELVAGAVGAVLVDAKALLATCNVD